MVEAGKNYLIRIYDSGVNFIRTNCLVVSYNEEEVKCVFCTFFEKNGIMQIGIDKSKVHNYCPKGQEENMCNLHSHEDLDKVDKQDDQFRLFSIKRKEINLPYINPITMFILDESMKNLPFCDDSLSLVEIGTISLKELNKIFKNP